MHHQFMNLQLWWKSTIPMYLCSTSSTTRREVLNERIKVKFGINYIDTKSPLHALNGINEICTLLSLGNRGIDYVRPEADCTAYRDRFIPTKAHQRTLRVYKPLIIGYRAASWAWKRTCSCTCLLHSKALNSSVAKPYCQRFLVITIEPRDTVLI